MTFDDIRTGGDESADLMVRGVAALATLVCPPPGVGAGGYVLIPTHGLCRNLNFKDQK
jgi:hypothetical protein